MLKSTPIPELKILVVDDDVATVKLVQKILETEGYVSEGVNSAEAAIQMIAEKKFHIVISDIILPGKDGLELLADIKKRDPLIQVMMLTGELTVDRSLQALERGAADFILKPIDTNELIILVRICEAKIIRWWGIVRTAYRKQKAKAKEEKVCGK